MEETIYNDLYYIIYNVLVDVCRQIMSKQDEETDLDITSIDDLANLCNDDLENEDDFEQDLEDEDDFEQDFEDDDESEEDYEEEAEEIEQDQVMELLHFLIGTENKYDATFETMGEQMEYPFIQDYILYKHIMMLMITSIAYCGITYDISKGIIEDHELMSIYDSIIDNPQSIYQIFEDPNNADIAKALIDCYLDYFCCEQYIRNTLSLQLIKDTGKLPKLLKMNPFEICSYFHCYSVDELTESEKVIQNFRDAYDYELSASYDVELDDEERMELFLHKLEEYYNYDNEKLNQAIAYIFSNIYENLRLHADREECQQIIELIEDNSESLENLIETYKSDVDFFWTMTDYFYDFNYNLDPEDLALLRWNFKTGHGNVKILKKLNSFYDEEEKVFSTSYFSTNE